MREERLSLILLLPGDSMSYHSGSVFSARDRDPNNLLISCAVSYRGAWWYRNCHYANLNGLYGSTVDHQVRGLEAARSRGWSGLGLPGVTYSMTEQITELLGASEASSVKGDNKAISPRCLEEEVIYWMERASSGVSLSPLQLRVMKAAGKEEG